MIQLSKNIIKNIIAYALYASGILSFFCKFKLNNKVVVLMYHRVLPIEDRKQSFSTPGIIVDPETFSRHINFLKKNFSLLSIDELTNIVEADKPIRGLNCIITFDDGWQDNYTYAFPILQKYRIKTVIFLPTDYIDTQHVFWQERLSCLLYSAIQDHDKYQAFISKYKLDDITSADQAEQKTKVLSFVGSLKKLPMSHVEIMIQELSDNMEAPYNFCYRKSPDRYLTWDQINTMTQYGVTFGSHAKTHSILSDLDSENIRRELSLSKEILESKLGTRIVSIAYPNGDYNDDVTSIAQQSGYTVGFVTECGYFSNGDNPLAIKRINIHDNATRNIPMLLCRMLGIF